MRLARFAAGAGALLSIALASTAAAAVRPVDITNFAFSPQSVTVTVGDTVTWTNRDAAAHSARVPGVGTTSVLLQGQSGGLAFNTVGSFPYDCGVHGASMAGTVIVRAAATPPPTPPPTPVPTVRTAAPTPVPPTVAATVAPTASPSPSPPPTPSPTVAATTAAPAPTVSATVAVVVPSTRPPAPAVSADGGAATTPLLVAAAVAAGLAVIAYALVRRAR